MLCLALYFKSLPESSNVVDSEANNEVYENDGHHHDEEQDDDLDEHHVVSTVAVQIDHLPVVQLSQQHRDHHHETVIHGPEH